MRGSKRTGRRPGTWELRVDAGRDPLTGSRQQKSVMFEGTSREADLALAELITKASRGGVSVGTRTVADVVEAGLQPAEFEGLEPTTVRSYRTAANNHASRPIPLTCTSWPASASASGWSADPQPLPRRCRGGLRDGSTRHHLADRLNKPWWGYATAAAKAA